MIDLGTAYIMMAFTGINVILCVILFIPSIFRALSNGRGFGVVMGAFVMVSEIGAMLSASNIYDMVKNGGTVHITNMFAVLYITHSLCAIVTGIVALTISRLSH